MRKIEYHRMLLLAILLLITTGCAGQQPRVEAVMQQGEKTIDMTASSFKFEPNNIRASPGDTIVLNITNSSGNQHNFTIKDTDGKIIQSIDLLPNKTEHLKIYFPVKGTYQFYCGKPLHPTLGMEGRIEVGP